MSDTARATLPPQPPPLPLGPSAPPTWLPDVTSATFIHELFEVALGAIGGLVAIGLVFHAVRCYILRSHWQAYAASLLGHDGIQLRLRARDGECAVPPALRSGDRVEWTRTQSGPD